MKVVEFKNVWEIFRIKFIIDKKACWDNYWALKDINFSVNKGETLGIIGENGAGKSTILKVIAGILCPDRGEINVSGKVTGLLELGAGFQLELTGRDNIYLNASLFGLTSNQIEKIYEKIASFACLGKFINAPVKCYSQGMFVRLAFAIAIHIEPDILLIDDSLAVGDEFFQRKCLKKVFELKDKGKTIIFVTHDMNMLRRLCNRAIFLKGGRIIKDDLVENIIPLYNQMVGVSQGVAVMEKGSLNIVFNNGKLFINWNGKSITPNSGIYTVFRVEEKWYSSFKANWEVQKKEGNEIIVRGKFYQLDLTQIWKIKITDFFAIKLDIEMQGEQPFDIQECCTNIMLTNEYQQWFTPLEKGRFSFINEKNRQWDPFIVGNVFRRCIGVESVEDVDNKLVSLAMEQLDYSRHIYSQVWNTDYSINCRVLQYVQVGVSNYMAGKDNHSTYFSGKISLNVSDIDNYRKSLRSDSILSNDDVELQFDKGQCLIYFKNENFTKISKGTTLIYANGIGYSSERAYWELEKEDNKLIARGSWNNLPVEQIWEISLRENNSFLWKVGLKVNGNVEIREQYLRFECIEKYEHYYSDYGSGKFPKKFLDYEIDVLKKCISEGIVGVQAKNGIIPGIFIKFSQKLNNFAKIFNSDRAKRSREIRIVKVEAQEKMVFPPGEYLSFDVEIFLEGNKPIIKDSKKILERGELKFVFNNGRGHLYWRDNQLTKKMGIYTSLRLRKEWYDSSSHVVWDIKEKKNGAEFIGRWLYLPIIQLWEVELKEGNILEFRIRMKVEKEIEVERLQTNVMLTEKYEEWLRNNDKGGFPLFKGNIDDDWEALLPNIECEGNSNSFVGVRGNCDKNIYFPTIKYFLKKTDIGGSLNVLNSDLYHRGRLLQHLNKEKMILPSGEYLYSKSEIVIEEL